MKTNKNYIRAGSQIADVTTDRNNKKCSKCNKGYFKERDKSDHFNGLVACDHCHIIVPRWKFIYSKFTG